jgi:S1-C subfamily serine protease
MSIDGNRTNSARSLTQQLRNHQVGDVITLGIRRDGQFARVQVRL